MAQITEHYNNLAERNILCTRYQEMGYRMLHDDFDSDWTPGDEPHGTLTFDDTPPPPPTPAELFTEQVEEELNSYHSLALQAYQNWGSLTLAQKDRILQFLLSFYLSAGQRLGYFSL